MDIVIIATRISGTDGVSLEASHWKEILTGMGHKVRLVAGELDRAGVVIPQLHFKSPEAVRVHDAVLYGKKSYREVEREIFRQSGEIEGLLREAFNNGRKVDLLIVPNVFSLPMHFAFAVALARIIDEKKIPTIARHHDFWWERARFRHSTMFPFFEHFFPPNLPTIKHVVINSIAQKKFEERTGIKAEIIWDSFNFDSKINKGDAFSEHWRKDFGISKSDIVFLQATRIVKRKRIELSMELIKRLDDPRAILVMAGYTGDESGQYESDLRVLAKRLGIRHLFIGDRVATHRSIFKVEEERRRVYTLWDCFVNADFSLYPTKLEGFGNQFVESVYFKKPVVVTPYPVFKKDIEPMGFDVIKMPDRVTNKTIDKVRTLINNPDLKQKMVEKNFEIGKKYLSYDWVEKKLEKLIPS